MVLELREQEIPSGTSSDSNELPRANKVPSSQNPESAPSSTAKHANVGKTLWSYKHQKTGTSSEQGSGATDGYVGHIDDSLQIWRACGAPRLSLTNEIFVSIKGISKTGGALIRYAWTREGGGLWREMTGECRREENKQEAELLDDKEAEMAQTRE